MSEMQAITMYKCPFCNKAFKTPNRHNCKHDPEHKNCITCANQRGFDSFIGQYDYYGNCEIDPYVMPNCEFSKSPEFEEHFSDELEISDGSRFGFIDVMYRNKWKLDCPKWKALGVS